jgi:DNA-directed RNA polymerase II subunit RPB1
MDDDGGMDENGGQEEDEDYEMLLQIQAKILNELHLFGVPGITKVYLSEKKLQVWDDNKGFEDASEWALETDGTNLSEVMTFPEVDHTTTVSNDIVEMFSVLGVEAARASLFNELRNVLSFDNAYVNYRHIACLADCMTFGGALMAVSRHGINNGETGPLLRASFEETVEVFMKSAAFSHYDILNGVTENVMLGQLARVGSGLIDLILDHKKLASATDILQPDLIMGETSGAISSMDKQHGGSITPSISITPMITPNFMNSMGSFTPSIGAMTPMVGAVSPMTGYQSPYFATSGAVTPGRAVSAAYNRLVSLMFLFLI